MGRPKPSKARYNAKGKPPSKKISKHLSTEDLDDDIDTFHKAREKIPLDINKDDDISEDENEEPIFDIKAFGSDESEDMDSDEDDLDEDELTGLEAKMVKQDKFLRQKTAIMEDEEEDEQEEEEEDAKPKWGKRKNIYYNADNVDYELQSSDEESPAEEEAEALRLQRKLAESLKPEDFELDEEGGKVAAEEDQHEDTLEEMVKKPKRKLGHGELPKSGDEDTKSFSVEQVKKDINSLSKEEQMEVVMSDAPELVGLLNELREGLDELQNKIEPLLTKVREGQYATKEGISYLETKHMLLLCYCQSIVFYLLLKAEGRSVRDHPVIARLVEIRLFLEKIRPIDKKMEYQIEKLLKAAKGTSKTQKEDQAFDNQDSLKYKPNPDMLVSKIDQDAMENGGVYRPPMIAPVAMEESKSLKDNKSRRRNEMAALKRASRSAFVKDLANELEGRPEEIKETIGAESKEMLRERERLEDRAKQEEEMFARVPLSRVEKKHLRHLKQSTSGLMGIMDDFDDDVADLVETGEEKSVGGGDLKRQKLTQLIAEAGKQPKKPKIASGDADLPFRDDLGERRAKLEMQKAYKTRIDDSEDDDDEGDDAEDLEEDEFYQEAKQLNAAKKAAKAAIYSRDGVIPEEEEQAEGKRHISSQIEKNRGLTPHRKKLTKNPRKKYKLKHQKAVIRRKGQVRDVKAPQGSYGGETTGIRKNISRSVRFQS